MILIIWVSKILHGGCIKGKCFLNYIPILCLALTRKIISGGFTERMYNGVFYNHIVRMKQEKKVMRRPITDR